jgi:hypothetical protein
MTIAVTRFEWTGLDEIIDELDRLDNLYQVTGALDIVLEAAYADTQVRVPRPGAQHVPTYVPTGALANSGATDRSFDGTTWVGEITYGGPSAPHDVEYAIYEMARGGIHDFFAGLPAFDQRYVDAILAFYRGAPG